MSEVTKATILSRLPRLGTLGVVAAVAVMVVLVVVSTQCFDQIQGRKAIREADEAAAQAAARADEHQEDADSLQDLAQFLDGMADASSQAAAAAVEDVPPSPARVESRPTPPPAAVPDLDSARAVIAVLQEDVRRLEAENDGLRATIRGHISAHSALERAFEDMQRSRDTWRDAAREFQMTTVAQAEQIDFLEQGRLARENLIETLSRQRRGWRRAGLATGTIGVAAIAALIITN